jgi:death-on-curing protein
VKEPRWLTASMILAIHADQIMEHGGSPGLRDSALLESALNRPRHRFRYARDPDIADLAAAHGFGIARNHPFVDGNKRTAFLAFYIFLRLNGFSIDAPEDEVVALIVALAAGDATEAELAGWIRERSLTT